MLDLDATDDPLHGAQEGRFFHGYYDCHCYLPLYIVCGEHVLCARLRPSDIDAPHGWEDELPRMVAQIRAAWARIRILLGGDSGFCREPIMAWCEAEGIGYVSGLARNSRLSRRIDKALRKSQRQAAGAPRGAFTNCAPGPERHGAAPAGWWRRRKGCPERTAPTPISTKALHCRNVSSTL